MSFNLGSNSSWWQPCPAGTYSNETGLSDESQCLDCEEGFYCEGTGNKEVTRQCEPGNLLFCCEFLFFICSYKPDKCSRFL